MVITLIVLPFSIYFKLAKIEQHLAKANQNGDVRHIYKAALLEDIKGNTKQTADNWQKHLKHSQPYPGK